MARQILDATKIHPKALNIIETNHADIVAEVQEAISDNALVIVGMAQNPAPKRARKVLDEIGIDYRYLEYGNYFKEWRRRNALKMWTGWPTFPMVFVNGTLIGGSSDMRALIETGELHDLLKQNQ
ncbi:MAG: glutaredoxin [SAR92 clade bacterium]|uniref:Glutaredoxin n=1 Tax=SAR92 clade bacterium TaxID=2315479 RepID=A0A520MIF5_9GAMM|nr:MAG: glutaredoxin [SAR92 clade bacterium]